MVTSKGILYHWSLDVAEVVDALSRANTRIVPDTEIAAIVSWKHSPKDAPIASRGWLSNMRLLMLLRLLVRS